MEKKTDKLMDVVGVGIGPFNLSVAALLDPFQYLDVRFFEREKEFQWHPGLLFPEANIQVSFLKDLVTPASPTSPYSFLNFLFLTKRLYRFINANFSRVTRMEFNQYLRWVCSQLPSLEFDRKVESVSFDGRSLVVDLGDEQVRTRNVILGSGLVPRIPDCVRPYIGNSVVPASRYLKMNLQTEGRRVAVIGGGQTGAEIIYHLLGHNPPRELIWISRRSNFLPLDESPFTNELFTPNYSNYFYNLAPEERATLLDEQKLTSDGIAGNLLEMIYRRLYELEFLNGHGRAYSLHINHELTNMEPCGSGWSLHLRNRVSDHRETVNADLVILCTGSEYRMSPYLEPLSDRLIWEHGGYRTNDDFSIEWDGPKSLKIYAQNAARHCRGVADPNLSLMAWRSATIVNSLVGESTYQIDDNNSVFEWQPMAMATESGRG
ncbi:MAG TPA: SidA/IucD/PvdA family monooxygenase [Pyrinomonadaceae bacterium]